MFRQMSLVLLAATCLSAAVLPILDSHPHSVSDIPLSMIFAMMNASSQLDWTSTRVSGNEMRSARVDTAEWETAKAALAKTLSDGSFEGLDRGPTRPSVAVINHASTLYDNINYQGVCYNTGFIVFKDEFFVNVPYIIQELRTNGGVYSYSWAMNHHMIPEVTLGYWVNTHFWDGEVNPDLIRDMFHYLIKYSWCGSSTGKMKGGLVRAIDINRGEVATVEVTAVLGQ